jgi:RNA polymerase sigma factor (sigma-70 family)
MSPLTVRRYRAERLLRQQFETLRARVLGVVRRRLRAGGVSIDEADLDACYAQAWQGLYMATLEGQEISNPAGWLVVVTFRRAIEEHRARARLGGARREHGGDAGPTGEPETEASCESDFAGELDDRARLRQLFEGLRGRLSAREREAAVLCYLQGLSRAQAASRMGVSEARMRKLMEGRGAGRPGVAGKVGALLETIRGGGWCEEQASLMRGLAYGLLDPEGERYQLALVHGRDCPACRAYVVSLRGLAAALPPVLMGPGLGAAMLALAGEGAHAGLGVAAGSANAAAAGGVAGPTAGAGGMPLGQLGVVSASGAAGAGGGAAGGSWLLAGPLGAKLAVACLLALGLGAGCIVLEAGPGPANPRAHLHDYGRPSGAHAGAGGLAAGHQLAGGASASARSTAEAPGRGAVPATTLGSAGAASLEFGPERSLTSGSGDGTPAASGARVVTARAASSSPSAPTAASGGTAAARPTGAAAAADREFAPG